MKTYDGRIYFESQVDYSLLDFQRHTPLVVSVPNTYESHSALITCGFKDIPHPLDDDTFYPGFTPYAHQKETVKFLTYNKRAWCLNDMGVGKTASSLWAAEHLRDLGLIKQVLIVCPMSTMSAVWRDEINKCYPLKSAAIVRGAKDKRLSLLRHPFDYFIINHDGIKIKEIARALTVHEGIDLIIVDEATAFKDHTTNRYRALRDIVQDRRIWALTGRPTPHNPTDAWAMSIIINPDNTPKIFNRFKTDVMLRVSNFKWVPRRGSTEAVNKILQPAILFKKEDCLDLPKYIPTINRSVEMTSQQKQVFKKIQQEFMYAHDTGEVVSAANAAVKLSKLLQVCCGGVYTDARGTIILENAPRESALLGIIEETNNKSIVFVPFKSAQAQVVAFLRGKKITCKMVNGDTSLKSRTRIFSDFQKRDTPHVLVAHPKVAAHGLTLTAADTIIWYAPTHSLEMYDQGNARIDRPGQTAKHLRLAHISAHPIERMIYKGLAEKSLTQQKVLSFYEQVARGDKF